jgi:hypothetical protein
LRVPPHVFVREFLFAFFEHRFACGLLSQEQYYLYRSALLSEASKKLAAELFSRPAVPVKIPGGALVKLIHLREMDGTEFPFLLALPHRVTKRRKLTCFVGHRFVPEIEGPLRFNLAHLLNPYRIDLNWSAQDLSASDMFRGIVKGIRGARMCFFDNFGTANKPNVYVEVGIAYALGVPTIVSEYVGEFGSGAGGILIPSDLQGLFRIQYRTYEELFRKLYFGLPNFMSSNPVGSSRRRGRRRSKA